MSAEHPAARVPYGEVSEPDEWEHSTAARVECASCGEWVYPRRPVDRGGPFALPPTCAVCGAPTMTAAQGHRDAELNEPRHLSTQRLAEIAFECLNAHGASLRPGSRRWQRNGITAVMELQRRAAS